MRRHGILTAAAVGILWLAGGCGGEASDPRQNGRLRFASGEGRVVTVQATLGLVTADTAEGRRTLWWDQRTEVYRGQARLSVFKLEPGQQVTYKGLESNGEIYLRKLWLK